MNNPQEKTVYLIRVERDIRCKAANVSAVSDCRDGRRLKLPSNSDGTKRRTRSWPAALIKFSCSWPDTVEMTRSIPCRAYDRLWRLV